MQYQEQIINLIKKVNSDIIRVSKAMPLEKLEWQPLRCGRPALNLLQECAQVPALLARVLEARSTDWYGDEAEAAGEQQRLTLTNIEACEVLIEENTGKLIAAIQTFPEDAMLDQVTLPFGAGGDWTFAEVIQGHYWNTTYHLGQISYIQTLYGDTASH